MMTMNEWIPYPHTWEVGEKEHQKFPNWTLLFLWEGFFKKHLRNMYIEKIVHLSDRRGNLPHRTDTKTV